MMEGLKVVTAEEMARIEKGAIQRDGDEERWMAAAGRLVAEAAMAYVKRQGLPKKITLLVGKGKNGGDAYAAGLCLLEAGYQVHAWSISERVHPLNKKFGERFRKKRGRIDRKLEGLVLDGLLGTGFKGKVDKEMARVIREANESGLPILAIDIPSGLNGTTGEVGGVAIRADETVTLGLPKVGFFLREGWNHVGTLRVADFGLPQEAIVKARAVAYLPKHVALPPIVRNRHKYQAGYVIGYSGSKILPGAAKLTAYAALKAGAGIVRLFSREEIGPAPFELICQEWDPHCWKKELAKARSVFIGPGLGKSSTTPVWLKKHLKEIQIPCVLDADALLPGISFPKNAILTPHRGEALRLLELKKAPHEEELLAKLMRFCDRKKVIVVLKGAPTFILRPKALPIVVPRGDPGMATAGAGDVLTGMIAGLLAQGCSTPEAAVLGVTLHAIAGEEAAKAKTSYCLTATDLFEFMPNAFRVLERKSDIV